MHARANKRDKEKIEPRLPLAGTHAKHEESGKGKKPEKKVVKNRSDKAFAFNPKNTKDVIKKAKTDAR